MYLLNEMELLRTNDKIWLILTSISQNDITQNTQDN